MSNKPLPGYRLALAATLLAVVVVVLGAFTRLVDAGLGCPDWPGCYGQLIWPDTPEEIARAEAAFPDSPVDNSKTWPEMVHRYCATLLGMVIIGLVMVAFRARKTLPDYPLKHCIGLLLLVICQGAFGAWTVTLKLWPQVVTAHLLGGFAVLSMLWLLVLRLRNQRWTLNTNESDRLHSLRPWLVGAILVVVGQIALGGWTSSNYAAIACTDFPTCQGHWLPPMDFAQAFDLTQDIGPNYLGGVMDNDARVTIHYSHRIGALLVTAYLLVFCGALLRAKVTAAKPFALAILGALALQVTLGISNVLYIVPLPVAVAHNAGGALLLLTLVTLAFQLHAPGRTEDNT
ncbi:COX15/CtaA family protein [Porticoccus sp. W117]|uniref:COX15/CtaA family protein n=1 Tax=Porticoccus sp. W117 TaxID=3054777 RepID=UPI002595C156|nr:COX15/CtaA family protein [Porticoccus sp. W117]MDM3870814.1 COX15/CtaA family protein [Porticoccus sp. W117]